MLKYNVQAVNKVAKHVTEVTDTVSKHGQFILEQTQYNEDAENEKANCTLIIRDIEKFERQAIQCCCKKNNKISQR